MKHLKQGFTLLELIIVMAVLAILTIALIAALNPIEQTNRGKDASFKTSTTDVSNALDRYFANNGVYPSNPATVIADLITAEELKSQPTGITVGGGSSSSKYYTCFTFKSKATKSDTVNSIYSSLPSGATPPSTACTAGATGNCTVYCLR